MRSARLRRSLPARSWLARSLPARFFAAGFVLTSLWLAGCSGSTPLPTLDGKPQCTPYRPTCLGTTQRVCDLDKNGCERCTCTGGLPHGHNPGTQDRP